MTKKTKKLNSETLHEYVLEKMHQVMPKSKKEIEKRLKKHELLKNSISSKLVVDDPQSVMDELR
ncbi:MAG: hypothetical protein ACE5J9_10360 [Methanosarcinales archaeon]